MDKRVSVFAISGFKILKIGHFFLFMLLWTKNKLYNNEEEIVNKFIYITKINNIIEI